MNWKFYCPQFEFLEDLKYSETAWHGHIWFAYDLIANRKPKKVVELGTHLGHSFFSFSQAAKDLKLDTELYAVDWWEGDEHAGFIGQDGYDKGKAKSVYEIVQGIHKKYYSKQKIKLIKKLFNEAVASFEDKSIDILHIDGLHTYEAVKEDFETWLPKMKKNGIVLMHDTVVKERGFGVHKYWDELMKKYKGFTFEHSHGLGIVFFDGKDDLLITLDPTEFKSVYSRSDSVTNELNKEVAEKDKVIEQVNKDLSKSEEEKNKLENQIIHLETEVNLKDKELLRIYSSWSWKLGWLSRRVENYIRDRR